MHPKNISFSCHAEIENYQLKYLSGKMFSIQRGKKKRCFWDASNFYKTGYGHMKLDDAAKKFQKYNLLPLPHQFF